MMATSRRPTTHVLDLEWQPDRCRDSGALSLHLAVVAAERTVLEPFGGAALRIEQLIESGD